MESKDGMTDMRRMGIARDMSERVAREEARKRGAENLESFAWSFLVGAALFLFVIFSTGVCVDLAKSIRGTTALNSAATIGKEAGK